MARKKEVDEVSLKPIGEAITKAQTQLKELAKNAPKEKSDRFKAKVEALGILHLQVQVICRSSSSAKTRPYGICKALERCLIKGPAPVYGISIDDDC
jgi:hypothetical protein